ncbi:hypothetical protein HDV02_006542 [Globomyces sp. JEL0801]|nr:hypothetical protein HDV02_006542 [Globomyces sp. JEL0801]
MLDWKCFPNRVVEKIIKYLSYNDLARLSYCLVDIPLQPKVLLMNIPCHSANDRLRLEECSTLIIQTDSLLSGQYDAQFNFPSWTAFIGLKHLNVSFNRVMNDDHMLNILSNLDLVSLNMNGCPKITKVTLQNIIDTNQSALKDLQFTISAVSYKAVFKLLNFLQKTLKSIKMPNYSFGLVPFSVSFPNIVIDHHYTYGGVANYITNEDDHDRTFLKGLLDTPLITFMAYESDIGKDTRNANDESLKVLDVSKCKNSGKVLPIAFVEKNTAILKIFFRYGLINSFLPFLLDAMEISTVDEVLASKSALDAVLSTMSYGDIMADFNKAILVSRTLINIHGQDMEVDDGPEFVKMTLFDLLRTRKKPAILELVIKHNIDVLVNGNAMSMFCYCIMHNDLETANYLVQLGNPITAEVMELVFSYTWNEGFIKLASSIWERNRKTSIWRWQNEEGNTLFHLLAQKKNPEFKKEHVYRYLQNLLAIMLSEYPNVHLIRNNDGLNPIQVAYRSGCEGIIRFFEESTPFAFPSDIDSLEILIQSKNQNLLLKLLNQHESTPFIDTAKLKSISISKMLPEGEEILSCFPIHLTLAYPEFLPVLSSLTRLDFNAPILIRQCDTNVRLSFLEFALHLSSPIDTILDILRLPYTLNYGDPFVSKWIASKLNEIDNAVSEYKISMVDQKTKKDGYKFELKTTQESNGMLNSKNELKSPKNTDAEPIDAVHLSRSIKKLLEIMNQMKLTTTAILTLQTIKPVLFLLIELFSFVGDSKPKLIEDLWNSASNPNSILDHQGNTILHLLAQHYPASLYPLALQNPNFSVQLVNLSHYTSLQTFCEHVDINWEGIANTIELFLQHPSNNSSIDGFQLFFPNNFDQDILHLALVRDLMADVQDSILSRKILAIGIPHHVFSIQPFHRICESCISSQYHDSMGNLKVFYFTPHHIIQYTKKLKAAGVDLNSVNKLHETGLDIVQKKLTQDPTNDHFVNIIQQLREEGARLSKEFIRKQQATKLHKLCEMPAIRYDMIAHYKDEVTIQDEYGRLPIHIFALHTLQRSDTPDQLRVLNFLMGNNDKTILSTQDDWIMTPALCSLLGDTIYLDKYPFPLAPNIADFPLSNLSKVLLERTADLTFPINDDSDCSVFKIVEMLERFGKTSVKHGSLCLTEDKFLCLIARFNFYHKYDFETVNAEGDTLIDCLKRRTELDRNSVQLVVEKLAKMGIKTSVEFNATIKDTPMEVELSKEALDEYAEARRIRNLTRKKKNKPEIDYSFDIKRQRLEGNSSGEILVEIQPDDSTTSKLGLALREKQSQLLLNPVNLNENYVDLSYGRLKSEFDTEDSTVVETMEPVKDQGEFPILMNQNGTLAQPEAKLETKEEFHVTIDNKDDTVPETDLDKLYDMCEKDNTTEIERLVKMGTKLTIWNSSEQYPLLNWLIHISRVLVFKPKHLKTFDLLTPHNDDEAERKVISELDRNGFSPLSVMLIHDVWAASVKFGYHNPTVRNQTSLRHFRVTKSLLTNELMRRGATLRERGVGRDTVFHGLARTIFKEDTLVPGFRVSEYGDHQDIQLTVYLVAVILRDFQNMGCLNLKDTNKEGMTGLDIIKERREKGDLLLTNEKYIEFLGYLRELRC